MIVCFFKVNLQNYQLHEGTDRYLSATCCILSVYNSIFLTDGVQVMIELKYLSEWTVHLIQEKTSIQNPPGKGICESV